MLAVFKREFLSFFRSPIGFIVVAIFTLMSGFYFSMLIMNTNTIDLSSEIAFLKPILFVVIPLMTMRLFTEDRKNGTEVLLYTSPVSLFRIVLGKYFAALALMLIMISTLLIHVVLVIALGGLVDAGTLGSFVGFIFLAAVFIAIGTFCSVVTENQIIAAITSFLLILFTAAISYIASVVQSFIVSTMTTLNPFNMSTSTIQTVGEKIAQAINWLDPFSKTDTFLLGIFSVSPLVFCISLITVFLFFTFRILEKRRWSQG